VVNGGIGAEVEVGLTGALDSPAAEKRVPQFAQNWAPSSAWVPQTVQYISRSPHDTDVGARTCHS
jgi:hypothetical protein